MSQFVVYLRKFSAPLLFFLASLVLIYVGLSSEQQFSFNLAALLMFLAAVFSFLFSMGKLNRVIVIILGVVALLGAVVTGVMAWNSVSDTTEYMRNYEETLAEAKFVLSDIRNVQKAYAERHSKYAPDFNTLIDYVKNGKTSYLEARGSVPLRKITPEERDYLYHDNRPIDKNMTEEEAYRLSKMPNPPADLSDFKRDTVDISFYQSKFEAPNYKEARKKAGLEPFTPESLQFIPNTDGERWEMETKDSIKIDDTYFPAIYVHGKLPYGEQPGKPKKEMYFGDPNLSTNSTAGSWEND